MIPNNEKLFAFIPVAVPSPEKDKLDITSEQQDEVERETEQDPAKVSTDSKSARQVRTF